MPRPKGSRTDASSDRLNEPSSGQPNPRSAKAEQSVAILAEFGREPCRRTDRIEKFRNGHEVRLVEHRPSRQYASRLVIRAQGVMNFSGQKLASIAALVGLSHVILHCRPLTVRPPAERGGRRERPAGRGQEGGPHPKGWNEEEEPRSGLRDAGTRPEGRAGQPSDRREADQKRRRALRGANMIVSSDDLSAAPADLEKDRSLGPAAGGAACVRRCA
jgi:hypothetical protein